MAFDFSRSCAENKLKRQLHVHLIYGDLYYNHVREMSENNHVILLI